MNMKHLAKLVLLSSGLCVVVGLLYAQVNTDGNNNADERDSDTQEMVAKAQQLFEEMMKPDSSYTCKLDYTVIIEARKNDGSIQESVSKASYTGSRHHMELVSDDFLFFQDTGTGVTIIPSLKEIQVYRSSPAQVAESQQSAMKNFHKRLFTESIVAESTLDSTSNNCRLLLIPEHRLGDIQHVEVSFNLELNELLWIRAEFDENSVYKSMTMRYDSLQCSEAIIESEGTGFLSLDRVYDSTGSLKNDYADYEVVDYRRSTLMGSSDRQLKGPQ